MKPSAVRSVQAALPGGPSEARTSRLNFLGAGPRLFEGLMRKHNVKTLPELIALTRELGVETAVRFVGRVDNEDMPALYANADIALNPSLVDNMPISLLEAAYR